MKRSKKEKLVIISFICVVMFSLYMALKPEVDPNILGKASPNPVESYVNENPLITGNQLVDGINALRRERGLRQLIIEPKLMNGAYQRALDLFNKNQWSHDGYIQAIMTAGITKGNAGENLSRDIPEESEVVRRWLNSPAHATVMLNPKYRYIGMGIYHNYTVMWVSVNNY